jgi:glycosyltransferase involved in cell wall biosynthesis
MMSGPVRPTISIIIKALNEERHIAAAIESAFAALDGLTGEVILADSASSDRTVEIAARYPIKIVRLAITEDRSCGIGVQLGYQYSSGQYLCLMDGDMELRTEFLTAAIAFLQNNSDIAGVSGSIIEHEKSNLEYVRRVKAEYVRHGPGLATCLEGGGLYRREAIQSVDYLGDRNLHAGEEHDLAARLKARGWKLARLAIPFVDHHGHSEASYRLLLRRWQTGYAFGIGEILRAGIGRQHFFALLQHMRKLILQLFVVYVWWACLILVPVLAGWTSTAILAIVGLALLPFAAMWMRRGSLMLGAYSVAVWNVFAAGLLRGLIGRRVNPADWVDSIVLQECIASESAAPLCKIIPRTFARF